jgi:hypothetical protein
MGFNSGFKGLTSTLDEDELLVLRPARFTPKETAPGIH